MEDTDALYEFRPLWSTTLNLHRIRVYEDDDPVKDGVIEKLSPPPHREMIGYVVIEDDALASRVRERMIAAGVEVVRWSPSEDVASD